MSSVQWEFFNAKGTCHKCNNTPETVKYGQMLHSIKVIELLPGGWWQSKSALNQSRDILFFRMASTLLMSQISLISLDF